MQREDTLDALAERYLAHGERGAHAAAMHPDDDAFEHLDALFVAFAHLYVHFHGVSGLHLWPFGHLCFLYDVNRAHGRLPSSLPSTRAGFPALPRQARRRPADRAAAPASARAPAACATCESPRDGPTPARQELSSLETPRGACNAGNRAAPARTNRPPRNLRRRQRPESASRPHRR